MFRRRFRRVRVRRRGYPVRRRRGSFRRRFRAGYRM